MLQLDASEKVEVHQDIEGDEVSLIQEDRTSAPVIGVVQELQPPSLRHYEKNVVEIHVGAGEEKKDADNRKAVPDGITGPQIEENQDSIFNVEESLPQDSIVENIHTEYDVNDQKSLEVRQVKEQVPNCSEIRTRENMLYQDDTEPKYKSNPAHEYPTLEHRGEQSLGQDGVENCDGDRKLQPNPGQSYDPSTRGQLVYNTKQTDNEPSQVDQQYVSPPNDPYDSVSVYDPDRHYEGDLNQPYTQESDPRMAYDFNQHDEDHLDGQYADDPHVQYMADSNKQYTADPNVHYAADPNEQYADETNLQHTADPNEQYADPNTQYSADINAQYGTGSNERYTPNSNEQYATDANGQYATDPDGQYAVDPNEEFATEPNEEYAADPNAQYDYYQNQPYQIGPTEAYGSAENEQYDYVTDQGYQHDPNQQYEHDGNQQYDHDPNQQYECDPNQQYEQDPNASAAQYPNYGYEEHEYGQNQGSAAVGYEEPEQVGNQQFRPDSQQDNASRNPEFQSSDEDYRTAAAAEQSDVQATSGDSYIQELSKPDDIRTQAFSAGGKKKNKDVISALLESDTESTIERNPSNNTESDFDFN